MEIYYGLVSITEMIDAIHRGRLRVPTFQRAFSWTPDQVLDLFESLERGLPIGSFIVWETSRHIPSHNEFGGQGIPEPDGAEDVSYVLDGLQRLITLFRCLYQPAGKRGLPQPDGWRWSVYRVLGETEGGSGRYRHWRSDDEVPSHYLPVRSMIRTIDFLAWQRAVPAALPSHRHDDLVDEAQYVVRRLKDYRVPILRLRGDSSPEAVAVFSRLNTRGCR